MPTGQLFRQMVEPRFGRHGGIDGGTARPGCAGHHGRQPVIGLGAHDDIHVGRARCDLVTLGLRNTAGDGEQHLAAALLARLLQRAQPPELGIDFLRCLLADMAGVEDDQIGVLDLRRRAVAERRQDIRHAGGVVDVHLAAEGLDVELFRHGLAVRRGLAGGRAARQSCRSPPRSQVADPSTRRPAVKHTCPRFEVRAMARNACSGRAGAPGSLTGVVVCAPQNPEVSRLIPLWRTLRWPGSWSRAHRRRCRTRRRAG